ncbi:MAG: hypothetical protein R3F34_20975, partial [Planctomycetota bacterium]
NSRGGLVARIRRTVLVEAEHWEPTYVELVARVPDRDLGNLRREGGEELEVEILEPPLEPFLRVE